MTRWSPTSMCLLVNTRSEPPLILILIRPDFVAPQFAQFDVTHVVHIIPPSLIGFDGKDKDWVGHLSPR